MFEDNYNMLGNNGDIEQPTGGHECSGNCQDKCKMKNMSFLQYSYGEGQNTKEKSDTSNVVSICIDKDNGGDSSDVSIIKSVNKSVTEPGDTLTYTVYVTNTGDGELTEVVLVDILDDETNYVDGSAKVVLAPNNAAVNFDEPVYDGATHKLTITVNDELLEGKTFIFSYDVLVDDVIDDPTMRIENRATVTTNETEPQEDSTSVATSYARVSIEKEIVYPKYAKCVKCDDKLTYAIEVEHYAGTIAATDVVVTDLFDSEFCFDKYDVKVTNRAGYKLDETDGVYVDVMNGLLTVTIDSLPVDEKYTITIEGKVCCCKKHRE